MTIFSPDYALPGNEVLVYHYTTWETAEKFLLNKDSRIRFGVMQNLNDPYEQSSLSIGFDTQHSTFDPNLHLSVLGEATEYFHNATRKFAKVLCTTIDTHNTATQGEGVITSLERQRRGFDIPPMWQHYSKNGEGVCLIFSFHKLSKAIDKKARVEGLQVLRQKIKYLDFKHTSARKESSLIGMSEINSVGHSQAIDKFICNFQEELFFTKDISWSYEKEFRWVVVGKNEDPFYVPINSSLLAVVLGPDFDPSVLERVNQTKRDLNIPIKRLINSHGLARNAYDLEEFLIDKPSYFVHELASKIRREQRSKK